MLLEKLKASVENEILPRLEEIENLEIRKVCSDWMGQSVNSLLDLLTVVTDEDDASYMVSMRYASLKAQWIEHNTHINYKLVATGEPPELLMQLASFVSYYLMHLEPLVNQKALEQICKTLADPMN